MSDIDDEMTERDYPLLIPTPEGVGRLLEVTRQHVESTMRPILTAVEEPGSGAQALVTVSASGMQPLPASFFDAYRERPLFRSGCARMTTLESFIAHVNRFGDEDSVVFVDDTRAAPSLTAVLDYHRSDFDRGAPETVVRTHGEYRYGRHRTGFAFPLTEEWQAWTGKNAVPMKMEQFSQFIEKRIGDFSVAPETMTEDVSRFVTVNGGKEAIADYATLLELSRGLKVNTESVVEEAQVLASGEGHLRFTSENKTRNAAGGTVKVPTMFFIAIPIFNRGASYRLPVALRYRSIPGEGVVFWYELQRHDLALDRAISESVAEVDDNTLASILFGQPE